MPGQRGRVAVVTGANSGLGFEAAAGLAAKGAHVVLACRSVAKGDRAAGAIRGRTPGASVEVQRLDLADLASVAAFAAAVAAAHPRLDLLVNNAGLMAVDQARTADGFELQLGVNHLGHFALTMRLLPLLRERSRIVTVSSLGHRAGRLHRDDLMLERDYGRWRAYFQSKLANLLFTLELDRRLRAVCSPTIAVAAHPGVARTDLGTEGRGVTNALLRTVAPPVTQPAAIGALTILRAATAPDARGGELYGPRLLVIGHPVRETPSRRARDERDARWLWERSVELTGLDLPAIS